MDGSKQPDSSARSPKISDEEWKKIEQRTQEMMSELDKYVTQSFELVRAELERRERHRDK